MPPRRKPVLERFIQKVRKTPHCWHWLGSKSRKGYGRMKIAGKPVEAHRWSYEHFVGPFPLGTQTDHLCGNPGCVNPHHLEAVTSQTNTLRGNSPPAINARKTHCVRGHTFDPSNTHIEVNGWRVCRACRREAWHRKKETS